MPSLATDSQHTWTPIGAGGAPNLDEVMVAGDCCEGDLRPQTIQTTRIIVACDYVRKRRGAIPAVLDDEHCIEAAVTQVDGNITGVRSGIAVPDVVRGIIVAGTIR